MPSLPALTSACCKPPASSPLVDSRAEQDLALETERLAGQELDQQFETAIREAAAAGRLQRIQAQVALQQDELDGAQQTPLQLGKISSAAIPVTLREQLQLWVSLGSRQDQVDAARRDADRKAVTLTQAHQGLEGHLAPAPQVSSDGGDDEEDIGTIVARLRTLSDQRKTLAGLDKRTETCRQLSGVYQR